MKKHLLLKKITVLTLSIFFMMSLISVNLIRDKINANATTTNTNAGWSVHTNNNLKVTADPNLTDVARVKETKRSLPRPENLDALVNDLGYDVTKAIEFDMYLNQIPYEAEADNWIGMFIMNQYSEEVHVIKAPNGTLNFQFQPYSTGGVKRLEGRYCLPTGENGKAKPWISNVPRCAEDNKVTLRIEVMLNKIVVYTKTNGAFQELFFIPEIGRSFFTDGKLYMSLRFHVGNEQANLMDLGMSKVRNTETVVEGNFPDYVNDGFNVTDNTDGTHSVKNISNAGTLSYRVPVNVGKKVVVNFKIDNIPGYHKDDVDTWLGIFLADTPGGHTWGSSSIFGALIRPETETEIAGEISEGEYKVNKQETNKIVFEAQKSKMKITINGQEHFANMPKNFYGGDFGYITFRIHNPVYAQNLGYNFTYSIANTEEIVMPQIEGTPANNGVYERESNLDYEIAFTGDNIAELTGNYITSEDYTIDKVNNKIIIKAVFMGLLEKDTTYTFLAIADQSEKEIVIKAVGDKIQIITSGRIFGFNKSSAENLDITIKGDEFKDITDNGILETDYSFANGKLTIKNAYLLQLRSARYNFTINGAKSKIVVVIKVEGATPTPVQIEVDKTSLNFDNKDIKKVEITATKGVLLNVVGNAISTNDFSISGRTLIFNEEFLKSLDNGDYTFSVYGEDNLYQTITLKVTNKAEEKVDEKPAPSKKGCGSMYFGGNGMMGTGLGLILTVLTFAIVLQNRKRNNLSKGVK